MLAEEETFLSIFNKIEDPRQDNANKKHLLIDVLAIAVCAVICGKESWYDVAEFGVHKEEWFKKFLDLPNGIPSHDTFRKSVYDSRSQKIECLFCRMEFFNFKKI